MARGAQGTGGRDQADEPAATLIDHPFCALAHGEEHAGHVDVHDAAEALQGHLAGHLAGFAIEPRINIKAHPGAKELAEGFHQAAAQIGVILFIQHVPQPHQAQWQTNHL